jgi:hypothetical protein
MSFMLFGMSGDEPAVYDVDAQAYFSAVVAAGDALTTPQKVAVNTFVLSQKNGANGAWSRCPYIWPKLGTSLLGAAVALKGNQPLTLSCGYSSARGLQFDGVAQYADCGLVPAAMGLTVLNQSISAYLANMSTVGATQRVPCGCLDGADQQMRFVPNYGMSGVSQSVMSGSSSGAISVAAPGNLNGWWCSNRTATKLSLVMGNSIIGFSTLGTNAASVGAVPTVSNVNIGCESDVGVRDNFTLCDARFFHVGFGMSDAQLLQLYLDVQTLQTSLGRQV